MGAAHLPVLAETLPVVFGRVEAEQIRTEYRVHVLLGRKSVRADLADETECEARPKRRQAGPRRRHVVVEVNVPIAAPAGPGHRTRGIQFLHERDDLAGEVRLTALVPRGIADHARMRPRLHHGLARPAGYPCEPVPTRSSPIAAAIPARSSSPSHCTSRTSPATIGAWSDG